MCRCSTQPIALCPHVEISAVAVVVLALAWLSKNKNKIIIIIRRTFWCSCELAVNYFLLAKLSVDVSDVFSHKLSKRPLVAL